MVPSHLLASHRSPTYTIGGIPATVWRLRLTGSCTMNCEGYSDGRPGGPNEGRKGRWQKQNRKNRPFSSTSGTASKSATPVDCAGELSNCAGLSGQAVFRCTESAFGANQSPSTSS